MTRLKPGRVRMPFPHLTLVSRSLTCQRSLTMRPALPLRVSLLSSTFLYYPACALIYVPGSWDVGTLFPTSATWLLSCHFQAQNMEGLVMFPVKEQLLSVYNAGSHPCLSAKLFICRRSFKVKRYNPQVFNTNIQTFVSQKDPCTINSCQRRERTGSTGHTTYWAGMFWKPQLWQLHVWFLYFLLYQQSDHPGVILMLLHSDSDRASTNELYFADNFLIKCF